MKTESNMDKCYLCPRKCGADRENITGYCNATNVLRVARAALHMWEEPCISGEEGSGTVFFSGCNLRCVFCQNYNIASAGAGKDISIERLAKIFMELQQKSANNINLVTAGHFVPSVIKALDLAKKDGLKIPIVYNTSGYESVETIKKLKGYVDIYLPDMKYFSSELSKNYSNAEDYFEVAKKSIEEMVKQVGEPEFDSRGIMKRGVIVRHLLLPGCAHDSKAVIKYLFETYKHSIYISIMNQYTPLKQVENIAELNRKVTESEYNDVVDYAIDLGVENGFIQEGETQNESYIPEFNYEGV